MSQTATTYMQAYERFTTKVSDGLDIFGLEWWVSLASGYVFDRSHEYQDLELLLVGSQKPLVNLKKEAKGDSVWVFGADDVVWQASPRIEADSAIFGVGQEAYLCCVFGGTITAVNGPFTLSCGELIERRIIEG